VGIAEVVRHLPRIYRRFHELLRAVDVNRPDAAVLIDFPDFNFRLARELHRRGIPVIYYISPQLWAWRSGRIDLVRRYVRKMLVIFPFEESWYRERGVDAEFVGHPLCDICVDSLAPPADRGAEAAENEDDGWIALLPGSRRSEVEMNFPAMAEAMEPLAGKMPGRFVVPIAPTLDSKWVRDFALANSTVPLEFTNDAQAALAGARAAVVASGTATVQAAMIGTPFVMVYRVSPVSWLLGRRLVHVPFFAMVNLIAGHEVVPELVQSHFSAANVTARLQEILSDSPSRHRMIEGLASVREKLCPGGNGQSAPERASLAVLKAIGS
jgi:lipid-A-disaccharide synthase